MFIVGVVVDGVRPVCGLWAGGPGWRVRAWCALPNS